MSAIIVVLKCITNMHVGNGEANFNIIDNEVERDPVTNYPMINSSGVKGALREFCDRVMDISDVNEIFGGRVGRGENAPKQGKLKFLAANMLAVPFRASSGSEPYYKVTTANAVKQFADFLEVFGIKSKFEFPRQDAFTPGTREENKPRIEGLFDLKKALKLDDLGDASAETLAYEIPHEIFRQLSLPVVARNCLEDGRSCNLWYEEVVPHKSVFYFPVVAEDDCDGLLKKFTDAIDGKVVQFGGNASIGCGLCRVSVLQKR